MENNYKPELRFPEFDRVWIYKKLGNNFNMKSGDFVSAKEISNEFKPNLFPCYGGNGLRGYTESYTHKGKYNLIGRQGALCGNVNLVEGTFHATEHAVVVDNNNNYDTNFINLVLKNLQLNRFAVGQAQPGLSISIIKSVKFYSTDLPEQTKIATFLTAIDKRIHLLEKKKTDFEQYKKGVMQKIFTQEIRFKPGQSGVEGKEDENNTSTKHSKSFPDWEEKKLGEVLAIGSGKDYKHLLKGNIPVYGTGGFMTSVNEFLYDGESVGIGRKGTIDKPIFLSGKFWTVDTLFYTHSFQTVLPYFIYFLFQQVNWKKYNEASGVPSLSKSTLEKIKFWIPSLPEQQKIANFLSAIDKKIEKTAKQIEDMKVFKKGLLQKMFV